MSDLDELDDFRSYKKSSCFSVSDGIMNIYRALKQIATNIGILADNQEKKGFASALLHYKISGRAYTNGQTVDNILSKLALSYKITGFGVSCLAFPSSAGIYTNDDVITAKLWDYTAGTQVGNPLTLTVSQLHAKHTDEGTPIGNNIVAGHNVGVKITYSNQDGGSFTMSDIDVFVHVEPIELMTDV